MFRESRFDTAAAAAAEAPKPPRRAGAAAFRVFQFSEYSCVSVGRAGGRAEEQLVRRSAPAHSDLNCAAEESRLGMMRNSFPTRWQARARPRPPSR